MDIRQVVPNIKIRRRRRCQGDFSKDIKFEGSGLLCCIQYYGVICVRKSVINIGVVLSYKEREIT